MEWSTPMKGPPRTERLVANPLISVGDLQTALDKAFQKIGDRDMERIMLPFRTMGCTWKTAPKA
jgi:hypothetical protein